MPRPVTPDKKGEDEENDEQQPKGKGGFGGGGGAFGGGGVTLLTKPGRGGVSPWVAAARAQLRGDVR